MPINDQLRAFLGGENRVPGYLKLRFVSLTKVTKDEQYIKNIIIFDVSFNLIRIAICKTPNNLSSNL